MSTDATTPTGPAHNPVQAHSPVQLGRMFIHPLVDYLLIGGGLSLIVIPFLPDFSDASISTEGSLLIASAILFSNSAHFAASTVRLYSKPGMYRTAPFSTLWLPLVFLSLLSLAIAFPDLLGEHVYQLYLSWSPYHYAAQAFGLAAMYGHRSGCRLGPVEMRLLRWVSILPFLHSFVYSDAGGLGWFVPMDFFLRHPGLLVWREDLQSLLQILTLVTPFLLIWRVRATGGPGLPLISLLILLSNGVWWVVFEYTQAFAWATIAHGVQYHVIMAVFNLKDHPARSGGRFDKALVVIRFYAITVALGYGLFQVLPYAYVAMGFPLSSSMMLVAAAVSIHHFVIDRVIWRVRKDPNYRTVVQ